MVIRQAHGSQNLAGLPPQTEKTGTPGKTGASFEALLETYRARTEGSSYVPVGTIHGSTGAPKATTPADPPPNVPFTATFIEGATITAPDGSQTNLNPLELATAPTAQAVASLLGGKVVSDSTVGGFTPSASTLEIAIPGSNIEINAGIAANLFATYGTGQGSEAWQIINQDLGRDPMATGPVG
jgi:hypothetical protein